MKIGLHDTTWGELICGGHMYVAAIAELLAKRGHEVTIVHHRERIPHARIAEAFDVDLSGVSFHKVDEPGGADGLRLDKYAGWEDLSRPYDVFLHSTGGAVPRRAYGRRNALLVHFPWIGFEDYHGQTDESWSRQPAPVRAIKGLYHAATWKRLFASYQVVISNSEFTRDWIRRRWKVGSEVVYPPTRPGGLAPTESKRPTILALGRMSPDKRPDLMIETFRSLCDGGLTGWRLAIVGGSPREPELAAFVASLHERARGYPIELLSDLPGSDLSRLLTETSLFWHSKGYGVDVDHDPQAMEHFGIATVEAMASGAVPLVFRGGGQPEIVRDGRDGFLWDDPRGLAEVTLALIGDEPRRLTMARSASARSAVFSRSAFDERFLAAMAPVLTP